MGTFVEQVDLLKRLINKIGQNLSEKLERKLGWLYIVEPDSGIAKEEGMVKIGWSCTDVLARVKAIPKQCKQPVRGAWRTQKFMGAKRAETIIHGVLRDRKFSRLECACNQVNGEWFKMSVKEAKHELRDIIEWMYQEPYDIEDGSLRPEWKEKLSLYKQTLTSAKPTLYRDFFLDKASNGRNVPIRILHFKPILFKDSPSSTPSRSNPAPGVDHSIHSTGSPFQNSAGHVEHLMVGTGNLCVSGNETSTTIRDLSAPHNRSITSSRYDIASEASGTLERATDFEIANRQHEILSDNKASVEPGTSPKIHALTVEESLQCLDRTNSHIRARSEDPSNG